MLHVSLIIIYQRDPAEFAIYIAIEQDLNLKVLDVSSEYPT